MKQKKGMSVYLEVVSASSAHHDTIAHVKGVHNEEVDDGL